MFMGKWGFRSHTSAWLSASKALGGLEASGDLAAEDGDLAAGDGDLAAGDGDFLDASAMLRVLQPSL